LKVLILGASGTIGSAMIRVLSDRSDYEVFGTVRTERVKQFFSTSISNNLEVDVNLENQDVLLRVLKKICPDVIVNCVGLTKHKANVNDPLKTIPINTLMPHRLANLCNLIGIRLIHISTDCVFSGKKGKYLESDFADARDVYGKSKALGEINYPNTITLRTSAIGHELNSAYGLLEWFLSQDKSCKGYSRAIFSGLPTVVFAQIIRDVVIPEKDLSGIYHVSAKPINKYDLLKLIAKVYGKSIQITNDASFSIDRSLNADKFFNATGYVAPEWSELIKIMYNYR
jgi:dTDP-4-dehydrorhamnose reductase